MLSTDTFTCQSLVLRFGTAIKLIGQSEHKTGKLIQFF